MSSSFSMIADFSFIFTGVASRGFFDADAYIGAFGVADYKFEFTFRLDYGDAFDLLTYMCVRDPFEF